MEEDVVVVADVDEEEVVVVADVDEEDVVVVADVDEEEELSKVFKFVNLLWLHGLIDGETLEKARKISSLQGCHEHEVSFGGEADLHRHYIRCHKNPGHSQFIPLQDFEIEHLPPDHRNNVIFDWIKAHADLTCRLLVRHTSENRPRFHPIRKHLLYPFSQYRGCSFMRTGTGIVGHVYKYTEEDKKNCECEECSRPGTHTPHKVWGRVEIIATNHVVFDDDEARRTTCYFGYDTSTTLLSRCLKLTGLKLEKNYNIVQDWCIITYTTHDMDIVNKLDKMRRHLVDPWNKLIDKYRHTMYTGLSGPCPVVIISHPHGCSKHITVGMWTHRQTWSETYKYKDRGWEADIVLTSYTYSAHTCPGSSGAPVFRLPEKGKRLELWTYHPHSEAGEGNTNNNKSAVGVDFVSPPIFI